MSSSSSQLAATSAADIKAKDNPVALSSPIVHTLVERVFSPLAQSQLLEFPGLAYHPNSGRKTIGELVTDYGRTPIVAVLQMAIIDLARFQGGTSEPQHLAEVAGQCAGMIVSDYYGYKPAEFSYFIAKVKRGDFGDNYAFTGSNLMSQWRKFVDFRNRERHELETRAARERTNAMLSDPRNVTDSETLKRITGAIISQKAVKRKPMR